MFFDLRREATLGAIVEFHGVGVHSGSPVAMKVIPTNEGHGVIFKRTDVAVKNRFIKLSPEAVVDPTLCTRVANKSGVSVSVIEHFLAALRICGITNVLVELNSAEVPIMDGSALMFINEFKKVGIVPQDAFIPAVLIKKPITVKSGNGEISITPSNGCNVSISVSYDRINSVVGANNEYSFCMNDNLSDDIAQARTFGWLDDYERIKANGFANGASEENTVVILHDHSIKNTGGLRNPKELVMHKCLDFIGDISVLGYDIVGEIRGVNTSHLLNNLLMKALLKKIHLHEIMAENAVKNTARALEFA
ncbi:MAG: UDP-3-O-acyl-N-acetylglucosamine deacetylase [Holosporales bacterium]|jgi:UDP-3-O-[3-hydroxymyristoyl] N-acetylglucosamine deacetylase|nr:UDP-3-O-acyl-N-acetylglucosamine deacetylase [Holosporales bacterium]